MSTESDRPTPDGGQCNHREHRNKVVFFHPRTESANGTATFSTTVNNCLTAATRHCSCGVNVILTVIRVIFFLFFYLR